MKKKWMAAVLAGILALTMAGCNKVVTETVTKEKDVTYNYSDAATRYAARADIMARNVLEKYIDEYAYAEDKTSEDWEVYMMGDYNPFAKQAGGEASVWHYTAVMGMTNRLIDINADNKANKDYYLGYNADLFKELVWFRGTGKITNYNGTHPETMYGVNRAKKRNQATVTTDQAVYDDQMWLIREHIAAYNNTGSADYLAEAERLTDVCLDGWNTSKKADGTEWGGITWGPYYSSFHTCSNAPLIKPLCDLAALYKDKTDKIGDEADAPTKYEYYLNWAEKVYDFTYDNLKNADNTYADAFWTDRETITDTEHQDEDTNDTHYVTKRKNNTDPKAYTYNVGAMISGGAELYKLTGEERYLTEARASAEAADHLFTLYTADGVKNLPSTSTVWFNLVLLQGYLDLAGVSADADAYIATYAEVLDYAYDHYYYNGFLPRNYAEGWVKGSNAFDTKYDVMDAAANAEMYAMLSQYYAK